MMWPDKAYRVALHGEAIGIVERTDRGVALARRSGHNGLRRDGNLRRLRGLYGRGGDVRRIGVWLFDQAGHLLDRRQASDNLAQPPFDDGLGRCLDQVASAQQRSGLQFGGREGS
jgi:hypothetical protein